MENEISKPVKTCCRLYGIQVDSDLGKQEIRLKEEQWKYVIGELFKVGEFKEMLPKNLLGDSKWVLYQHIISLNDKNGNYTFRCGSYAFDKISKFTDFKYYNDDTTFGHLNLNGETVSVIKMVDNTFDKKKIIISKGDLVKDMSFSKLKDSFFDDIILYFA